MPIHRHSVVVVLVLALLPVGGCVRSKVYRSSLSVVTVPPVPKLPTEKDTQLPNGRNCGAGEDGKAAPVLTPFRDTNGNPVRSPSYPCLAFVEFNEKGYTAVADRNGAATQLEAAKELIRRAIADDPQHQPVIITFIHGWKHNSNPGPPEDTNIQGLEEVLDRLYTYYYAGGSSPLSCATPTNCPPAPGHVVIGIYLSWRGESVSEYWPVARTFSVYSRGAAAKVIGNPVSGSPGVALPESLNEISAIAHPPGSAKDPHQPLLIFVGHSFGAKVLERAMGRTRLRPEFTTSGGRNSLVLRSVPIDCWQCSSDGIELDSMPCLSYFYQRPDWFGAALC